MKAKPAPGASEVLAAALCDRSKLVLAPAMDLTLWTILTLTLGIPVSASLHLVSIPSMKESRRHRLLPLLEQNSRTTLGLGGNLCSCEISQLQAFCGPTTSNSTFANPLVGFACSSKATWQRATVLWGMDPSGCKLAASCDKILQCRQSLHSKKHLWHVLGPFAFFSLAASSAWNGAHGFAMESRALWKTTALSAPCQQLLTWQMIGKICRISVTTLLHFRHFLDCETAKPDAL